MDILSIGNITQDVIKLDGNKHYSLGGTSFYAYKVAESTRGLVFTNNGNYNMDILKASIYGVK